MVVNSMSYATYDSYKDSGVDWLGEIPNDWDVCKLKFLLDEVNVRSKSGNEELLSLSKYQGIIPKNSLDERSGGASTLVGYKKVFKETLVINKMQATNGLLAISKIEGITSPDYSIYKTKNNEILDIDYLGFLLTLNLYLSEFKKRVTGVMEGFIRLYTDDLYEIHSIIPPITQQKKIVNFLNQKTAQIDQAIALKQQQIEKLNEYKQIVIQNAVTKGLDPNAPMKNSGVEWIGNIPEHWDVKKNTHLFNKIGSGTTPTSSDLSYYDSGDINWLQTGDLNNDYIVATSRKINQKAMSKFSSLKLYDENSLVIAMYGATIGKVGLLKIKSTTNQACCVLGNSDKVFMKYIFYVMQFAKNHLISNSYGGGQPNINQDMIKNLRIPYPNLQEQEKIANYLDDLNEKIYKTSKGYQTQIDRLKEYKNILINQAVTGKIKI